MKALSLVAQVSIAMGSFSPHSRTWCLRSRGSGVRAEDNSLRMFLQLWEFQVKWIDSTSCRYMQVHMATQTGMTTFSTTGF